MNPPKRFGKIGILLFFLSVRIFGEPAVVESISFIPQTYYVGDRVELRAILRVGAAARVAPPKETIRLPWGNLLGLRVSGSAGKWELKILFAAYHPGTQAFPSFRLGDASVEGLKVHVKSLMEEGYGDFLPPQGQLLLPSTKLLFGLVIGGFIALPLAGGFLLVWIRPRFRLLISLYREKKPYRNLLRVLKNLRNEMSGSDSRRFYIALLDQLKLYLTHRGGVNCRALTTREMSVFLESFIPDKEKKEKLLNVFVFGDEVKFGGKKASEARRREDLAAVELVTAALETKEGRRVHL